MDARRNEFIMSLFSLHLSSNCGSPLLCRERIGSVSSLAGSVLRGGDVGSGLPSFAGIYNHGQLGKVEHLGIVEFEFDATMSLRRE